MYKLCKTEQSTKRQREIENTLLSLLEKKHFDDITITELCEKCEMPRKAFYRYFDSKESALYALVEHTYLTYSGLTPEGSKKGRTLREEMRGFFTFWYQKKNFLDAMNKSGLLPRVIEISLSFPINDYLIISKFLPNQTPWEREQIFKFTAGGLLILVMDWYKSGFKADIASMADVAASILESQLFSKLNEIGRY
ncbi:MAG: TetR/AcrR family transcriptional regulator [Clostridia bacterium]|nr:TetR/AcrR family transcriptional regulator [Clostridia bacterium]